MAPRPRRSTAFLFVSAAFLALATTVAGALARSVSEQDEDRIWGRVRTTTDERYEGFVVWAGRGAHDAASWADFFEGDRIVASEVYEAWLAATDGAQPVRTIEVKGRLISWNEEDPEFPLASAAGVRFGRLAEVVAPENGHVQLKLRSPEGSDGSVVRVRRPSRTRRALTVADPDKGETDVAWGNLQSVEFSAPPPEARAASRRLHGTVEDGFGRSYTGYVAWDSDEILESEVLDGTDEGGKDRDVRFEDVRRIEQRLDGALVELASGRELTLSGTNDVDRRNRGVRVFDPAIGMVEVEWEEFETLRLEPVARPVGYGDFESDWPLAGVVVTQDGDSATGRLRWDAEHEWSWELLRGESNGVKFAIEFGKVARIERAIDGSGSVVTLADGRAFELAGSGDVDWDSRGVFVLPDGKPASDAGAWHYVDWGRFREVRFLRGAQSDDDGGADP